MMNLMVNRFFDMMDDRCWFFNMSDDGYWILTNHRWCLDNVMWFNNRLLHDRLINHRVRMEIVGFQIQRKSFPMVYLNIAIVVENIIFKKLFLFACRLFLWIFCPWKKSFKNTCYTNEQTNEENTVNTLYLSPTRTSLYLEHLSILNIFSISNIFLSRTSLYFEHLSISNIFLSQTSSPSQTSLYLSISINNLSQTALYFKHPSISNISFSSKKKTDQNVDFRPKRGVWWSN